MLRLARRTSGGKRQSERSWEMGACGYCPRITNYGLPYVSGTGKVQPMAAAGN